MCDQEMCFCRHSFHQTFHAQPYPVLQSYIIMLRSLSAVCSHACMQGLDPAFVARLGDFEFRGVYVQLSASDELSTHQHPNALRNALRQLGALHATARPCNPATITPLARVHPELHLQGWDWEQEGMAEAVSDYMPELPMLNRFVKVDMHEPLTDGRLGAVLALGQHVHGVSVGSLDLHTDAHAYDAWPWEWFECHGFVLNNTQLFRLPHPRSYKGRKPRPVVKLVDSWILNVGKVGVFCMGMCMGFASAAKQCLRCHASHFRIIRMHGQQLRVNTYMHT